jgi:hypothetical protein
MNAKFVSMETHLSLNTITDIAAEMLFGWRVKFGRKVQPNVPIV